MYEMMKSSMMDHVKGLFLLGNDTQRSGRYRSEVLRLRPRDPFQATCVWARDNGGLTDADLSEIEVLRERRNRVAHPMPMVISETRFYINLGWLNRIRIVAAKFDRWWLRHFEIDDIDPDELPDEEIHSGNMVPMDLIIRTVDGRSAALDAIHQGWRDAMAKRRASTGSPGVVGSAPDSPE